MDLIYTQAVLTVIAACGNNADARLIGLQPIPRHRVQNSECVDNLRLFVPTPTVSHALGPSKWSSRSWTFQEYQLSHRQLVFIDCQVYFHCTLDTMVEDVVCEKRSSLFSLD